MIQMKKIVSDEDYNYENNPMAEFQFDTKLDYVDRVERAIDAFSEFLILKSR